MECAIGVWYALSTKITPATHQLPRPGRRDGRSRAPAHHLPPAHPHGCGWLRQDPPGSASGFANSLSTPRPVQKWSVLRQPGTAHRPQPGGCYHSPNPRSERGSGPATAGHPEGIPARQRGAPAVGQFRAGATSCASGR